MRGRPIEDLCKRDGHDDRLWCYQPARVICLNCGRITRLSDLRKKDIVVVKQYETGILKDNWG